MAAARTWRIDRWRHVYDLSLDRIADQETILVTEDEVVRRIQNIALTYNRDPEEVMEEYQARGRLDDVRVGLRREKVREFLRKKANKVPSSASGERPEPSPLSVTKPS